MPCKTTVNVLTNPRNTTGRPCVLCAARVKGPPLELSARRGRLYMFRFSAHSCSVLPRFLRLATTYCCASTNLRTQQVWAGAGVSCHVYLQCLVAGRGQTSQSGWRPHCELSAPATPVPRWSSSGCTPHTSDLTENIMLLYFGCMLHTSDLIREHHAVSTVWLYTTYKWPDQNTHLRSHIHTYAHKSTHTHTCALTHLCSHIPALIYTRTLVCTHIYTHKHFKTPVGLPPVTSHMTSMGLFSADGMYGKLVTSGGTLPGRRRTRPKMRWSHRNGSLVSSVPGTTVFMGKFSWGHSERRAVLSFWCTHDLEIMLRSLKDIWTLRVQQRL